MTATDVDRCPACGQKLSVTHSYEIPGGRMQARLCDRARRGCGARYTDTVMVSRIENTGRGKGAYAQAQKLREQHAEH